MSFFYQTINDLFQPLLLFGILLALLQYSGSQISNQRQTRLRRILSVLSESSQLVLFILAVVLGVYIMFKLVVTVIGWVFISYNIADTILGQQIPSIDYQMGIGASILLLASLSILIIAIIKLIKHRRGKKSTETSHHPKQSRPTDSGNHA